MPDYRRDWTQIDILRFMVRRVGASAPYRIDAWAVLPHHMHCLETLPPGDANYPRRWHAIKTAFAKYLATGEPQSRVMTHRGDRGICLRPYCEDTLRDDRDFAAHMDCAHFNPVKHGFVEHPADSPHFIVSSMRCRRVLS